MAVIKSFSCSWFCGIVVIRVSDDGKCDSELQRRIGTRNDVFQKKKKKVLSHALRKGICYAKKGCATSLTDIYTEG